MTTQTIESIGIYTPRYRITGQEFREAWGSFQGTGIEEKAVPAADEDAVTMAVAAAERALDNSAHDREEIKAFTAGTTNPPLDEGDVAAQIAQILDLNNDIETALFTQSTRAGTRAMLSGMRMTDDPTLIVAADCPFGEPDGRIDHTAGAGAVAMVLSTAGAVEIIDTASYTQEFSGTRFRERGNENTDVYDASAYERKSFTQVTTAAIQNLADGAPAIAPSAPDGKIPTRIAGNLEDDVTIYHAASSLGDTGAASPFFGLAEAWSDGSESVIIAGYGDGASADAVLVDGRLPVTFERDTVSLSYTEYLQRRGHIISPNGGAQ